MEAAGGTYAVSLDGRRVKTPAGAGLQVPSAALAEAIAAEWRAQEDEVAPATMPMMGLACTAIDRVEPDPAATISELSGYAASDVLCYRAEAPRDLVSEEAGRWDPLLDWCREEIGASLTVSTGVVFVEQAQPALSALETAVAGHDAFELTALSQFTRITGSIVLALAASRDRLTWEDAFETSRIEEAWQAERWGEDREAEDRSRNLRREMEEAAAFLVLVRS